MAWTTMACTVDCAYRSEGVVMLLRISMGVTTGDAAAFDVSDRNGVRQILSRRPAGRTAADQQEGSSGIEDPDAGPDGRVWALTRITRREPNGQSS
jgi:hypothetical protein